jgi:hypothetical protein
MINFEQRPVPQRRMFVAILPNPKAASGIAKVYHVKTTVSVLFPLGHEILDWAINPRFLGEAETNFPPGWRSWDRTGVLESGQFVFDWETPHIAMYAAFILLRLQDLAKDARDKYAETAKNLEKRIRGALKFQRTSGHEFRFKTTGGESRASR